METTTVAKITEDRSDFQRALAMHQPSGELYLVEYCSLWTTEDVELATGGTYRDQNIVGTRIFAACGPIVRRDLLGDDEQLVSSVALFDRIRHWEGNFTDENAEWLQAEEDAGRLDYP